MEMIYHEGRTYEGRVVASRASEVLLFDCPNEDILRCLCSWSDGFVKLKLPLVQTVGRLVDHGEMPVSCCRPLSDSDA